MSAANQSEALSRLIADETADLPDPGQGATADRHLALFEIARRHPVGVARLFEAHVDARSICREAGRRSDPQASYGVWASASPGGPGLAVNSMRMTVTGRKPFCSGLGIVDHALITAEDEAGRNLLLDVDVRQFDVPEPWATPALRDTATGIADFADHPVSAIVGPPGFYLSRPGFWHGACGPAACWAGAAAGLVDTAEELTNDDPHRRAHLGRMRTEMWVLRAILRTAGEEIDERPDDAEAARRRALKVRHAVERSSARILDSFGQSLGPRPFVSDPAVAERFADTHLYLRQHHSERDLQMLGDQPLIGEDSAADEPTPPLAVQSS